MAAGKYRTFKLLQPPSAAVNESRDAHILPPQPTCIWMHATHTHSRAYMCGSVTLRRQCRRGESTQPVLLSGLLSLLDLVVEYLLIRGEFERWRAEEASYGVRTRGRPGGGGHHSFSCLHSALRHIVISGAMEGVKPCSERMEGWKEKRGGTIVMEGMANCWARSPDRCDLQEGGGGENHCSHFEKGGGYKTPLGVMVCHKASTTAAQLT